MSLHWSRALKQRCSFSAVDFAAHLLNSCVQSWIQVLDFAAAMEKKQEKVTKRQIVKQIAKVVVDFILIDQKLC